MHNVKSLQEMKYLGIHKADLEKVSMNDLQNILTTGWALPRFFGQLSFNIRLSTKERIILSFISLFILSY